MTTGLAAFRAEVTRNSEAEVAFAGSLSRDLTDQWYRTHRLQPKLGETGQLQLPTHRETCVEKNPRPYLEASK